MQQLIKTQPYGRILALVFSLVVICVVASPSVFAANVVIQNADTGTTGFNDPTPVSPVGGNMGTTLGQQRMIALQHAADSTDGGVTFTDLSTPLPPWPNGNYQPLSQKFHADQQSFAFDPENGNTFYVGNDGGLWNTGVNGFSFTSLNSSLSLTQFVSLGVHPTDTTRSYGGTQDNRTQLRLSGGNGWREFSTNFNLSGDRHTRVILFTSSLGLSEPDPSKLIVRAGTTSLLVENVGIVTGVPGMAGSYIIVRLPDGLPSGDLPVVVTLNGAASNNMPMLAISP